MACLYSCRHPLWGGTGTCSEQDDLIGYECSCDDDGFTSMDSFGNPSCVLRRALVAGYIIIAVCGSSTVGFLAWNALKQSHLPRTAQATRRAVLRLRLIWSASAYSGSASIIFCVAAADGGLYANGLKALCSITFPLVCMAVAHMIDLWINTLPTQLVPADSVAIKVIKLAEKKNLCLWVGWLAIAGLTPFGLLTFFVLDVIKVVRAVNLVTGGAALCAVICFNFVGVNLTKIINGAKRNAGPSSIAFYEQAIHTLRIQVFALTVAGVVWIVMVVALEPYLGGVGARTPVIPFTIMVFCFDFVGFNLTKIINEAKRNVEPSARPFYEQAVRTLRIEAFALSVVGMVWITMVVALEPRLGGIGARTPVIPLTIMLLDASVGFCLAVHFAKVNSPKAHQLFHPARPVGNRTTSPGGGVKAMLSDVGAKVSGFWSTWAAPGQKRVVPVKAPSTGNY